MRENSHKISMRIMSLSSEPADSECYAVHVPVDSYLPHTEKTSELQVWSPKKILISQLYWLNTEMFNRFRFHVYLASNFYVFNRITCSEVNLS
mgnify:CR=1 FL=1